MLTRSLPETSDITAIDLTAVIMHPAELKKLEDLPYLRTLYLPGPIWNPGGGKEDRTGVFKTLTRLNQRAKACLWLDLRRHHRFRR